MTKISGIKLKGKNNSLIYEFYPVEFSKADKEKILQGVVLCIVLESDGKILIIRRKEKSYVYPDYNGLPAGHIDFGETPENAAIRELYEETKLKPIFTRRVFKDNVFIDDLGHFGFVYLCIVDENNEPVFDEHEINSIKSEFISIKEIIDKLNSEKFTPLARMILIRFLKEFPRKGKIKEIIDSDKKKK